MVANTTPPIDIRITYDPAQTSASRWPAYNQLTSLVRNTVYSRLEEKAANLKQANYEGHRAIIVRDGGYGHLNATRYFYEDHIDDVFRHFLKEHLQISFILTFAIKQIFGFNAEQTLSPLWLLVPRAILGKVDLLGE